MAHFTNTREFYTSAQPGDTCYDERLDDRTITHYTMHSVETDANGERHMTLTLRETSHYKWDKLIKSTISTRKHTYRDGIISMRFSTHDSSQTVGHLPVKRYSKNALLSEYSRHFNA